MQGREHHFVPQFYLRGFSSDGKRINCFNFSRKRLILDASIKHQCSRHNFHTFLPQLEQLLGELEQEAAVAIRTVIASREVPPPNSPERNWLLRFVVFQKLRTTKAARMSSATKEFFEEQMSEIQGPHPTSETIPPIAIPLSLANEMVPVAADLQMHLLCNDTACEFLTSDDPVVVHNQYCEGIDYRGVNGWRSSGLQVVLPLSPKELLFMFDPAVYKVGLSHKGVNATSIANVNDVEQLNAFQILNAEHNAYFADGSEDSFATKQCEQLSSRRPATRWTFIETEAVRGSDGHSSSLLHNFEPLLPARLQIDAISIRKRARRVPLDQRASLYRKNAPAVPRENFYDGDIPEGRYAVKQVTKK